MRDARLIKAGTKFEHTIANADLAPTLIEFTNSPKPDAMHGRSWPSLLKGDAKGWREAVLLEYFHETNFPRIRAWQPCARRAGNTFITANSRERVSFTICGRIVMR
jgi:hypothetical protein